MLSKEPFEKFNLLPLSFSRVSSFINNKAQWYITYIHGYRSVSSAMQRGTVSEEAVMSILADGVSYKEACKNAIDKFDESLKDHHDDKKDLERNNIPIYIDGFISELKDYHITDYQEKQEFTVLDIPLQGYTDFGLRDNEENYFKVDLKSSGRMPTKLTHSIALQQTLYSRATNQINKVLYCVVAKDNYKTKWFDITHQDMSMSYFEDILISMHSFLSQCETHEDIKKGCVPILDDWIWGYDKKLTKVRKDIWKY
jgi:hypothetical protein